jgi:hypothetical protein
MTMREWLVKVGGITLGLLLVLSGVNFAVRAIAQRGDTPRLVKSILLDESCPSPCWQGIQLGETSLEDTLSTLANLPDAAFQAAHLQGHFSPDSQHWVHWEYSGTNSKVDWVYLQPEGVRLGDVIAAMGQPAYMLRVATADGKAISTIFYYPNQGQTVVVQLERGERYSPLLPVLSTVMFGDLADEEPPPDIRETWCGFHFPTHLC